MNGLGARGAEPRGQVGVDSGAARIRQYIELTTELAFWIGDTAWGYGIALRIHLKDRFWRYRHSTNYLAQVVLPIDDLGVHVNLIGSLPVVWMAAVVAARFHDQVNGLA